MEKDYAASNNETSTCPIAPRELVIKRIMAFSKAYEEQKEASEKNLLDSLKN
ncbi:MAG: hypothetical protein ACON47_06650 [Flavobacteriaceae bacterium]